jgi:hypothetical protein
MTFSLLLASLLAASTAPAPKEIALVGGTLLDVSGFGRSSADIQDAVVVLRGDEIVAAGPRASVKIPPEARRIDVSGKYIVPGLTDGFGGLGNQSFANAYLYMGVTSVIGVEGPPRYPLLDLKADPSPRIYPLEVAGYDYRDDKLVAFTEAETMKQMESLAAQGKRVILIHYAITPERTAQMVAKGRQLGLGLIGEHGATRYDEAIRAGVPAFVHSGRYSLDLAPRDLAQAVANDPSGPARTEFYKILTGLSADDPRLQQHAQLLGSSPVALMPTLSHLYLGLPGHRNPWKEPVAKLIDPKDVHQPANPATGEPDAAPSSGPHSFPPGFPEAILRIEEQYRRAGAKYLAGSGTPAFGTMPGISLHTELELLTRIGLPARQVLAAATGNFGEVFGWKGVGQVKAGYNADVLVLNANPLQDIANLKNIHLIILKGEVLDREKLLAGAASGRTAE